MTILEVLDGLGDAALVVDRDGTVLAANAQATRQAAAAPGDLAGAPVWRAGPPAELQQRAALAAAVRGRPGGGIVVASGERWTEVVFRPLPPAMGESEGPRVLVVRRDVTDRVRAQEEVKALRTRLLTAQDQERASVARDLHDDVGQSMTALLMELRSAEAAPDEEARLARLRSATGLVRAAMRGLRQVLYRLTPPALETTPLPQAIEDYGRSFGAIGGFEVTVEVAEPPHLTPGRQRALYRLLQEGLNNVAKHAAATRAAVTLSVTPGLVALEIRDDGRGFDPGGPLAPGAGLGLTGMAERFRALGGDLEVEAAPGAGARLRGTLPVPAAPERNAR
ncbi:sensor histidine kinase [Streptomyces sp. DSM 44917]|uniref:Oxygen sensor histidine kinase NreB n=1 Tax=Streptomyces boetiae TaxID=3075541 RepID=A0ABU2L9B8_9ACTN|nr:sensor histidine kinase [Streptomyces sp. DSM 44917]MDT0307873.1 sensor histidine kinase [Streptomyces sp. DSM 44917]